MTTSGRSVRVSPAPITASVVVAALALVAFSLPGKAEQVVQPPWKGCAPVDKREYQSAKKLKLLHGRGTYVRTGRVLQRHYWYCP